jgi:23S rRNA (uracil1939-C5)-methyltransferase
MKSSDQPLDERRNLHIDSLAAGGDGVARDGAKVVFVSGACPGDTVVAQTVQRGKKFDRARAERVIEAGPWGAKPECPVFLSCGGCQWQQVAYEKQLEEKKDILAQNLKRLGGFDSVNLKVVSNKPYGYRIRVRMVRTENGTFGFREEGSHEVADASECKVVHPDLLIAMQQVGVWMAERKFVCEVDVGLDPHSGEVAVWMHDPVGPYALEELVSRVTHCVGAVSGSSQNRVDVGRSHLMLSGGEGRMPMAHPIDAFWQANDGMNVHALDLIEAALKEDKGTGTILELFAGSGNLTRVLAATGRPVVAVEQQAEACVRLSAWVAKNKLNVEVWCQNATGGLARVRAAKLEIDTVVLDPPRSGLGDAVDVLLELAPDRIVYMSCDTATLSRDTAKLRVAGYALQSATMMDFFPQTHHIESLLVLTRET